VQNCQLLFTQAEKWRLFEVKLPIEDDPGKDTHETSVALCSAVALKLKCKVKPPKFAHAALPSSFHLLTCAHTHCMLPPTIAFRDSSLSVT